MWNSEVHIKFNEYHLYEWHTIQIIPNYINSHNAYVAWELQSLWSSKWTLLYIFIYIICDRVFKRKTRDLYYYDSRNRNKFKLIRRCINVVSNFEEKKNRWKWINTYLTRWIRNSVNLKINPKYISKRFYVYFKFLQSHVAVK